jgi:hypothetical protein
VLLLDCERHTELVGLCQVALCRAVPGCCASRYTRTAGCPFLSPAASAAAHPLLQAGCWPSACCCVVLQDDAGPGLEEPASSLQLAQLLLQEQLDARACARLCWLQMEGPYRLCRLGPYILPGLAGYKRTGSGGEGPREGARPAHGGAGSRAAARCGVRATCRCAYLQVTPT